MEVGDFGQDLRWVSVRQQGLEELICRAVLSEIVVEESQVLLC